MRLAREVVSFMTFFSASTSLSWHVVSAEVMVLLVAVRVATVVWYLAVAVAKFAMASTVSCW